MSSMAHPDIDQQAQPAWMRTGYKFFPYAARQAGQWWVLRFNYDFPAHEMYTVFVDACAAADVTGHYIHQIPLAASTGALEPFDPNVGEPTMEPGLAETIVGSLAPYVVYGSEAGRPCVWCEHLSDQDPMTLRS